jgi:anti-sigma factor ChrR (cupin superfamily)
MQAMILHADFSRRAIVTPDAHEWVPSPRAGVERVMLDRLGEESGRATSLVRYAPGAGFPAHSHPRGEEILVLSGTFSEGETHHPAGTYLRNPPGSAHQPHSPEGTLIFVKLWQMAPDEQQTVCVDTTDPRVWTHHDGCEVCKLFEAPTEQVRLMRLPAGAPVLQDAAGGAEMLVIEGSLREGARHFAQGSWIRLPDGDGAAFAAGDAGAMLYMKTGHLRGLVDPVR